MKIRDYGEVVLCRNITFEDNKYDIESGHPGIILLPTTEKEEELHCLYMTSNIKRAKKESNKYIKYQGESLKDSYVNIQQIIKRPNIKDLELDILEERKFIDLLETFYNYQRSREEQSMDFLEIESKVEILLELLKTNKELGIQRKISREELDTFESLKDKNRMKLIYATQMQLIEPSKKNKILNILKNEKDRKYSQKLIELYTQLKEVDFNKINVDNLNNGVRQLYFDFKLKNYLINTENLFQDASDLFSLFGNKNNEKEILKQVIQKEKERQKINSVKKEQKAQENIENRRKNKIKQAIKKANAANRMMQRKYGKFKGFDR